jgi:hypothetical protein
MILAKKKSQSQFDATETFLVAGRRIGGHSSGGRRSRRGNGAPVVIMDNGRLIVVGGAFQSGAVRGSGLLAHESVEAELVELHLQQDVRLDPVQVLVPDSRQARPKQMESLVMCYRYI